MCKVPKMETPSVSRIANPNNDAVVREGEMERALRRNRNGVAADILTSPMGLVGRMMGA